MMLDKCPRCDRNAISGDSDQCLSCGWDAVTHGWGPFDIATKANAFQHGSKNHGPRDFPVARCPTGGACGAGLMPGEACETCGKVVADDIHDIDAHLEAAYEARTEVE